MHIHLTIQLYITNVVCIFWKTFSPAHYIFTVMITFLQKNDVVVYSSWNTLHLIKAPGCMLDFYAIVMFQACDRMPYWITHICTEKGGCWSSSIMPEEPWHWLSCQLQKYWNVCFVTFATNCFHSPNTSLQNSKLHIDTICSHLNTNFFFTIPTIITHAVTCLWVWGLRDILWFSNMTCLLYCHFHVFCNIVIFNRVITSELQFAYKKHHATPMCTLALKEVVKYYTSRRGSVFIVVFSTQRRPSTG